MFETFQKKISLCRKSIFNLSKSYALIPGESTFRINFNITAMEFYIPTCHSKKKKKEYYILTYLFPYPLTRWYCWKEKSTSSWCRLLSFSRVIRTTSFLAISFDHWCSSHKSPSTKLQNRTRFFRVFHSQPRLMNLHTFGCVCFVHLHLSAQNCPLNPSNVHF